MACLINQIISQTLSLHEYKACFVGGAINYYLSHKDKFDVCVIYETLLEDFDVRICNKFKWFIV